MRYVIIGASAAGMAGAQAVLELDPAAEVVILSEEVDAPYCRPLLSYWLAGETAEDLFALAAPALTRVDLRLGARAQAIEPGAKRLRLASGEALTYDRLLLATGAASATLEVPGEELPNVRGFRTRSDAATLDEALRAGAHQALVLGGGLVGIKAAHALAARGASVTLCVASSHPLSQAVDREAGALVADALREEGIEVRPGLAPSGIEEACGRAAAVTFAGAWRAPCDLVVVGKGVTPRTELLADLGFAVSGGVPVDAGLRTPLPDVWAAGDVALATDTAWGRPRVNAVWPMAVEQGALAGRNMAGAGETYAGSLGMNSIRVGRLELISAGITRAPDPTYEERAALDRRARLYRKVVLKDGRIVGTIFAGAADQAGLVVSAIRRGARFDELPFDPLEPRIHWGRYAFTAGTLGRRSLSASQPPSILAS
ncbi:MAG: FAD-dependent oxidoreductase [Deltaproteobacteria bacterium]|nr:FAD-dependent oxidoreductase [Deltaproteobacteria bacterium]